MTTTQQRIDDPTGVFITGAPGLGRPDLVVEFVSGARESGADVHIIDVPSDGCDYSRVDAVLHTDIRDAVNAFRALLRHSTAERPVVVAVNSLAATLRHEGRLDYRFDDEKLNVDRENQLRDELGDLIADAFVFGASRGVIPIVETPEERTVPLISRVKQASSGWVHVAFTAAGEGTLHSERGAVPFHLPTRSEGGA
ncbi:hypothetical protein [Curtobacterium sp. MCBD17_040]|uniref:hypothetical protein n=1 Tax=Curtobacterium sp. MCBD17_040 TaxID=2175674 RepID=UPI000DA7C9C1|nr:hypothetical protein [Curtobacterium sp. MCBD17_040]WIB65693.1 hypothetical protein DEI94_16360 [Curtobacterium sp. MCBD17_040]